MYVYMCVCVLGDAHLSTCKYTCVRTDFFLIIEFFCMHKTADSDWEVEE